MTRISGPPRRWPGSPRRSTIPGVDVTRIIDPLNEAQRAAVAAPPGHQLVLAGAGSGKTRVLVHRVAWLLATGEATPWGVYVVTFTNKAAGEMRRRIEDMLGHPAGGMWTGTFHGLANRLLRRHGKEADLPEGFQILDSEDQVRCIRRVLRDLDLDEKVWLPRWIQGYVNARKDEGLRAGHLEDGGDERSARMIAIYRAYEETCQRNGLVDFAELLLRAHELLRGHEELLLHYRRRFTHLLVDEFQDTNAIQYAWLRLLAGEEGRVFAVGDDDQSIYSWRGARAGNIRHFTRDFPGAVTCRLEQNYRSTRTILSAANALIANNRERLGKDLWTEGGSGDPIRLYSAFNEVDEARFVVSHALQCIEEGLQRSDVAVLYRVSAQSRALEEALLAAGVPYRVYGGLRFYERAEIKDALAYLRLIANPDDDTAFERVVNLPPRGIGARTMERVRRQAREEQRSLWAMAGEVLAAGGLNARAANALRGFLELLRRLREEARDLELDAQVRLVIERSGLVPYYERDRDDRIRARRENLDELVNAASRYASGTYVPDEEDSGELAAFLAHAALESGEEQADAGDDYLHLMTLHSAKGLEFPVVFLTGLEEGLFPHQRSIDESGQVEEERRLCYVGMTRARRRLVLSHAESRRLHGGEHYPRVSRFVGEIPAELVEEVRLRAKVSRPLYRKEPATPPLGDGSPPEAYRLGQRVVHPKFGEGIVLVYEGQGAHTRVQVNFDGAGAKWLVLAYAKLQPA